MTPHRRHSHTDSYTVRLYDHFDGWLSGFFTGTWEECLQYWNKQTKNGTKLATPAHNRDYWDIFPANTRMLHTPASRGRD